MGNWHWASPSQISEARRGLGITSDVRQAAGKPVLITVICTHHLGKCHAFLCTKDLIYSGNGSALRKERKLKTTCVVLLPHIANAIRKKHLLLTIVILCPDPNLTEV